MQRLTSTATSLIYAVLGGGCAEGLLRWLGPRDGLAAPGLRAYGFWIGFWLCLTGPALARKLWEVWNAFPSDEYGPLSADREAYEGFLAKIKRRDRHRAARMEVQRRFREALLAAFGELPRRSSEARMRRAQSLHGRLQRDKTLPKKELARLEERFAREAEAFRTDKYMQEARYHLRRAGELSTTRGRRNAIAKAVACLEEGMLGEGTDSGRLAELLEEVRQEGRRRLDQGPEAAQSGPSGALVTGMEPVGPPLEATPAVESQARAPQAVTPQPRRTAQPPIGAWIPPGETVEVAGRPIEGGLIYVGSGLQAIAGGMEPALIDPELPVAKGRPDRRGADLDAGPSYQELTPASRAAYLDWLAGGRKAGEVGVGYAHLFLAGIERRLLHRAGGAAISALAGTAEYTALRSALREVRSAYESEPVLRRQSALLDRLLVLGAGQPQPFPADDLGPGEFSPLSVALEHELCTRAAQRKPLPADWARAWLRAEKGARWSRVQAELPALFKQLFSLRYEQAYGSGLVLDPEGPRLHLHYTPLSSTFGSPMAYSIPCDLPAVADREGPLSQLRELALQCEEQLAPYLKWHKRASSRSADEADLPLAALACLPEELLVLREDADLSELRALIMESGLMFGQSPETQQAGQAQMGTLAAASLQRIWAPGVESALRKTDCAQIARMLAKLKVGVEPDVRFGASSWTADEPLVLFLLGAHAPATPSRAWHAATLVVHLAVLVSVEGSGRPGVQLATLREELTALVDLEEAEYVRLAAHLRWMRSRPPKTRGLRRRIATLEPASRSRLARFLLRVAGRGGAVTPAGVRALERLYELLDLERQVLHSDLHALASPGGSQQVPGEGPAAPMALDPDLLHAKLLETAEVSALLAGIFCDAEETSSEQGSGSHSPQGKDRNSQAMPAENTRARHAGLDDDHSAMLSALALRAEWSRPELEDLAAGFGLLTDGALDRINDASFEALGEPLWEGEDPLEVDLAIAAELLGLAS